jgi:predicted membrane protein
MIYLLAVALILTSAGFWLKAREKGALATFLDALISIVFGFLAGIFIGVGARIGMWAIAFANGDASRFSVAGTIQVIAVFACFGLGLGLIYEGFFRRVLRARGLLFGILITLCAWYPLGESAAQVMNFQPTNVSLFFWTLVCVASMFLPFGVVLEWLLKRRHRKQLRITNYELRIGNS